MARHIAQVAFALAIIFVIVVMIGCVSPARKPMTDETAWPSNGTPAISKKDDQKRQDFTQPGG